MKLFSIITTSYATLRKFILSVGNQDKIESVTLEAIILKCQKTGKQSPAGDEVKLLLHISPANGRSYLHEHIDVYEATEIIHFLQPGRMVNIEKNSAKGKAILSWKE